MLGCRAQPRPAAQATAAPRRVVTLAPNLTEIVFALGAGDSLVGVSEYSDFPEAARAIPRVGGLEIDPEKVAALRPDLVLAVAEGNAQGSVRALEAAGLPVAVTPSGSLDAVLESIRIVAERLGRTEEGSRLVAGLERRRAAVRERIAGRPRPRTLLLVWPDPPQAAGGQTFLNDLLTEAGADNIVGDRRGWPILSGEYVATAPVELLIVPDSGRDAPGLGPGLRDGRAFAGPGRARPARPPRRGRPDAAGAARLRRPRAARRGDAVRPIARGPALAAGVLLVLAVVRGRVLRGRRAPSARGPAVGPRGGGRDRADARGAAVPARPARGSRRRLPRAGGRRAAGAAEEPPRGSLPARDLGRRGRRRGDARPCSARRRSSRRPRPSSAPRRPRSASRRSRGAAAGSTCSGCCWRG